MATIKQRLLKKNSSGSYDTIHLETSVDCLTGILPIEKGGTGTNTLSGLVNAIVPSISTASIKYGTYQGNGATSRTFNLSGYPQVVLIHANGMQMLYKYTILATRTTSGVTDSSAHTLTITTTGFTIKTTNVTGGHINGTSITYFYIAFM